MFVPKVWGGQRFSDSDSAEPIGEIWTASDKNLVAEGQFGQATVAEAINELGQAFLGDAAVDRYGIELPLITKFLDTGQWLSVQVHPDDNFAHTIEADTGFHGKTEAWLFLETTTDAQIAYGLQENATIQQLRQWIKQNELFDHLALFHPKAGDLLAVPAGTIHALGPGLCLFEVQQRSELTYRLFDFDRKRELHIDKALQVADTHNNNFLPVLPWQFEGQNFLFAEHDFVTVRHHVHSISQVTSPSDSFSIFCNLESMRDTCIVGAGASIELKQGAWLQSFMVTPQTLNKIKDAQHGQ